MATTTDEYVRVTDKDTGHRRSVLKSKLHLGNYQVLKSPAVDPVSGDVVPPEFKSVETTPSGQQAETKKES